MNKLTLDVDTLDVESFATHVADGTGTVAAHQIVGGGNSTTDEVCLCTLPRQCVQTQ